MNFILSKPAQSLLCTFQFCKLARVNEWTYSSPSSPSPVCCSASMALSSGLPTLSRKQRQGSARMVVYISYPGKAKSDLFKPVKESWRDFSKMFSFISSTQHGSRENPPCLYTPASSERSDSASHHPAGTSCCSISGIQISTSLGKTESHQTVFKSKSLFSSLSKSF